ncbi:tetratricopeptide repeat protein [Alkalinema pantanalense CENA528]|uniref:tetratricopeptide repeat protein n=1 Tax=Alkalinema pantanalense TaxID=1620705 RepID=UPI003D6E313C
MGRDREMRELHDRLRVADRVAIAAVGMGGVGKTTLARQYAKAYEAEYPGGIWWVSARSVATDILGYAARSVGLEELDPQLDETEVVRHYLARWDGVLPGRKLLVLDDVGEYRDVKGYLPLSGAFQVLMTTRVQMQRPVSCLALGVLEIEDAIDLLLQMMGSPLAFGSPLAPLQKGGTGNLEEISEITGEYSDSLKFPLLKGDLGGSARNLGESVAELGAARELCEWLGRLPLAIELVGRYLSEGGTIAGVLAELRAKSLAARAIDEVPGEMDYGRNVQAAIALSWQPLDERARLVLGMVSVFAIGPIEVGWVRDCLPEVEEVEEVLDRTLVKRSLLSRLGDGRYQMHALVREFVAVRRPGDFGERFARVITEIAKTIDQTVTVAERVRVQGAVPQMEEVAAKWTEGLEGFDKCWCCNGLGRFYGSLSLWQEAERCWARALEISQEQLSDRHPDTAASLNNLAALYSSMGRYKDAEQLYLEALKIYKEQLGDCHLSTAASLNNLAELYRLMGRYKDAEPLCLKALEIRKARLGKRHLSTATSLNNLAELYRLTGRYRLAKSLYRAALNIRKEQLGYCHPDTATSLNNLAALYRLMGRYKLAKPLYRAALNIRKEQLGYSHPDTATSLNNLAALYESMRCYGDAEPLYLEALEISKEQLGDRHPDTATSLNNLAALYKAMERHGDAEPLYLEALEISKEQLGDRHPDTATSLNNLAGLYSSMGRYEDAKPLLLEALEISEEQLGDHHPDTAMSLNNLAVFYANQGQYDRALPLLEQALSIYQQVFPPGHPNILSVQESLENVRWDME